MPEVRQGGPVEFNRAMDEWLGQDVGEWVAKNHKAIHFTLVDGLIDQCPVGNPELWQTPPPKGSGYTGGRARGGFQSSAISAPTGDTHAIDPNGLATKEANRAAVNQIRPWSRSWIVNNVPYITALNDRPNPNVPGMGWSTQAPLQWMEAEVDRVKAWFDAGLIKV